MFTNHANYWLYILQVQSTLYTIASATVKRYTLHTTQLLVIHINPSNPNHSFCCSKKYLHWQFFSTAIFMIF